MKRTPVALAIGGSDPSAGAGIEADLQVFLALGQPGVAAATALTTQDSRQVHAVRPVPVPDLRARLDLLADDAELAGVKAGLLPSPAHVRAVAAFIAERGLSLAIVDPVLAPTRGRRFLAAAGLRQLRDRLLPLAELVTPNLPEAAALLGLPLARVVRGPATAAERLRRLGPRAVLLKGGHADGRQAVDVLVSERGVLEFAAPRIRGPRGDARGTGCALAAAILAERVRGRPLEEAIAVAKRAVLAAMRAAWQAGRGRLRLGIGAMQVREIP